MQHSEVYTHGNLRNQPWAAQQNADYHEENPVSQDVEFVEAQKPPICPHCNATLARIEYRRQKISFGFMSGWTSVIILTCPHCQKVLGT